MKYGSVAIFLTLATATVLARQTGQDEPVTGRARNLHMRALVIDTHADTTQRLIFDKTYDIGTRNEKGSIDIPRMREGGLDALFFSIWVTGDVAGPLAAQRAREQIQKVREAVRLHPRGTADRSCANRSGK